MSDFSELKRLEIARIASNSAITSPESAIAQTCQTAVGVLVSDAATAGTAVTETVVLVAPYPLKVVSAKMAAPIAVTASDSTYATVTVATRSAGGSPTTVAVMTTKTSGSGGTGNMTAFVPYAMTVTTLILAAGDVLTLAIAKASTGVALTAATSYFEVELVIEAV